MERFVVFTTAILIGCFCAVVGQAATVTFFDPSQTANRVSEGATWDKIRSNGYYFTYTRDKLFTGGGPVPIGRYVRVPWPVGVEAQAVTAGPSFSKAKITIERVDGDVFDFTAFTAKLLAITGGAGGAFEVVPFLNGEEVFPDPITFDATDYYGGTFSYNASPNPWGSTAPLIGYDKYTIDLYVDFALIGLTFVGAPIPGPAGDYNNNGTVDAADYVVWRDALETTYVQSDFDVWRAHFGQSAGSGAALSTVESLPAAISEPTTFLLLMFAAGGRYVLRHRAA